MLTELRIRNFALIDRLSVKLGPGLNVLSGETGAGKSIVVGALSLLLGERASAEVVRAGEDRATVEGVFDVPEGSEVAVRLGEYGIDLEEGTVILKREVAAEGRSRAWISGSPATVGQLGLIGGALVNLHGQHEHQTLLRPAEQMAILDAFGGSAPVAEEVAVAHAALVSIRQEIDTLERRQREAAQRADFLRFQVDEIEGVAIESGEEERLSEEGQRLSHAEELLSLTTTITAAILGDEGSASSRLGAARRYLDQLVRIDPAQGSLAELFDTAYYALEELASRLDAYTLVVEHDPARLDAVRARQDELYRLGAKYGPSLEDVFTTLQSAKAELALVDDADWAIQELNRREADARGELMAKVAELSEMRAAAAASLEGEVSRILPELGMDGGVFEVRLVPLPDAAARGAEDVEFRVSLNRGFEPRPLANVASGGELSRVMLALKTILARLDSVPTLIFDEVDAGIGGRVALQVGEKMRQVAEEHQVLAITHLPQIAARAHQHLLVRKTASGARVATEVIALTGDQRVSEMARMLGGDPESDVSLAHARELLEKGDQVA